MRNLGKEQTKTLGLPKEDSRYSNKFNQNIFLQNYQALERNFEF